MKNKIKTLSIIIILILLVCGSSILMNNKDAIEIVGLKNREETDINNISKKQFRIRK